MAEQPITWKTLAAPDLGTSVAAVNQGAQNIATGLNTLGNVGNSIRDTNIAVDDQLIKDDTNKVLAGLANIQSKDEWDAMKASGELNPDKISSLAPRADLGLVAQALEAKDKDIEATVAQGINNLYNTTQIDNLNTSMASRKQADEFTLEDRKAKETVAATEAALLKGDVQQAAQIAGDNPEAMKAVSNFDSRLRKENFNARLASNDFDGALELAETEAEKVNIENKRKEYNEQSFVNQVAVTGEVNIPENLSSSEKLSYATKAKEAQAIYLQNEKIAKDLSNFKELSGIEDDITSQVINNNFDEARSIIRNSGLKGKGLTEALNTVKNAEDTYKAETYKSLKSTSIDISSNLYSKVVGGSLTDRQAIESMETYLASSGLNLEDADKIRNSFNSQLDNYTKMTPAEQTRLNAQLSNLDVVADTAVKQLELEFEKAKQDYPIQIRMSEIDPNYNLNVTQELNTGLVSKFSDDFITFDENDSTIESLASNITNYVDGNKKLEGLPPFLISRAIQETIDGSTTGVLGNFNEDDFTKRVKSRIEDYVSIWNKDEANRSKLQDAQNKYLENISKTKQALNTSKAELTLMNQTGKAGRRISTTREIEDRLRGNN